MILVILKTLDKDEKDGFPKLWVRTFKNWNNYHKSIPTPKKYGAWKVWRVFKCEEVYAGQSIEEPITIRS